MILVKATADSEAGVMPSEKLLTDMGAYNEELVKAAAICSPGSAHGEAQVEFSRAASLTRNGSERALLRARAAACLSAATGPAHG